MWWLGAIVSLCYVPGYTGAFVATQWPVLSIVLPLFLWRPGAFTVWHVAGLVFLAYAVARLAWSPFPQNGMYEVWMFFIAGLSFWLGSTASDLRRLYAGLWVGAAVSSVVAVTQALGLPSVTYVSVAPAGLYANSVAQGAFLSLLTLALLSERMFWRAALLAPGILLSGSRGAWLALAIGLLASYARPFWALAAAVVAASWLAFSPLSSSDDLRVAIWHIVAGNMTWFGAGPGALFSAIMWYKGAGLYPEYAHNDALQLGFEYGLFSVLPFSIGAFVLSRRNARQWPVVVGFAVAACYSMPTFMPAVSFLAFVCSGRVVRDWALVRGDRDNRGSNVVSRRPLGGLASFVNLPVVSHHPTEG